MSTTEGRPSDRPPASEPVGATLGRIALERPAGTTRDRALAALAIRAGRAHMAASAWKHALEDFGRALALDPSHAEARLYVLWARWKTRDPREGAAAEALEAEIRREIAALLAREPDSGLSYYVAGMLRMEKGDLARAERALIRSLLLDPENRDAQRHLRIVQSRLPR